MKLPEGEYWMYLRKSRADLEAEARGEGETLKKHEQLLYKLAKAHGILITETFREIVSGESIYHRPEMLRMMAMMEERRPKGVLVVDMDRLGRGDMQEQGLILGTFRRLGVKIITPRKIYDLNDEFDEEYSEFEAFMARKELKIITRRLQRGRLLSVEAGNYIATRPPYGYEIMELPDGTRTLRPHPEQAEIVKQIFRWYTHTDPKEQMGSNKIATKLNEMGIPSYTGRPWTSPSVLAILKNAVYAGRIQWKKKEQKKSRTPGKKRDTRMRDRSEWIDVPGKHEPLIDMGTFQLAQERLKSRYHAPFQLDANGQPKITTALAGLVKCANCGKTMVYRPYVHQKPHLRCNTPGCQTRSTQYELVERRVLESLEKWLADYKVKWSKRKKEEPDQALEFKRATLTALQRELNELEHQKGRLFDLLERGIYSEELFLERSQNLARRIQNTQEAIERAKQEIEDEEQRQRARHNVIPMVENVVKSYYKTKDPVKRNALLKSVLHHAVYNKDKHQRGDNFTLELFPKV